jgi:hypothetical protein
MAFTVGVAHKTVFGNMRVHILSLTADGAADGIDTGLDFVYGYSLSPVSMTTAAAKVFKNAGATGTSLAGYLGISGVASGDEMQIVVYGR